MIKTRDFKAAAKASGLNASNVSVINSIYLFCDLPGRLGCIVTFNDDDKVFEIFHDDILIYKLPHNQ